MKLFALAAALAIAASSASAHILLPVGKMLPTADEVVATVCAANPTLPACKVRQ